MRTKKSLCGHTRFNPDGHLGRRPSRRSDLRLAEQDPREIIVVDSKLKMFVYSNYDNFGGDSTGRFENIPSGHILESQKTTPGFNGP